MSHFTLDRVQARQGRTRVGTMPGLGVASVTLTETARLRTLRRAYPGILVASGAASGSHSIDLGMVAAPGDGGSVAAGAEVGSHAWCGVVGAARVRERLNPPCSRRFHAAQPSTWLSCHEFAAIVDV